MYSKLDVFSPDIFLVELGNFFELEWATHKTDVRTIVSYMSDSSLNRDNHIYKYDLDKDEYNNEARGPLESKTKNVMQHRELSKNETPEHFEQVLQIREENACIELSSFLGDYNRVVMHCGLVHYPVYEEYLNFLSSESF